MSKRKQPTKERTCNQVVRILDILDLISELGFATLKDVTKKFLNVSDRTIRRDLDVLERIGRCEASPFNKGEPTKWRRARFHK